MRRYLAYRPDEVPRIFRMLDLIAHGAEGHGLVHLLHVSAADLGFAWDGGEVLGPSCPPPSQDAFGAYPTSSERYF